MIDWKKVTGWTIMFIVISAFWMFTVSTIIGC